MRLYVSCLLLSLVTALLVPNSAEAQASDVDCVALFDGDGTRVARASNVNFGTAYLFKEHNGFTMLFRYSQNSLNTDQNTVYFTDANCSSTPFVFSSPNLTFSNVLIGLDVYYSDPAAVPQNVQALSYYDGSCNPTNQFVDAVPVIGQVTLPQYTPPFRFESEACYTPPAVVAALTPYGLGAMALVLAFGAYLMVHRPGVA